VDLSRFDHAGAPALAAYRTSGAEDHAPVLGARLSGGFVPDTLGEDGDPIDVVVLLDEPSFPGFHVMVRPFGVFRTADAFLVLYFATLDPMGPSPTTELRMVRLIPAS
jgi:hypothetical protein